MREGKFAVIQRQGFFRYTTCVAKVFNVAADADRYAAKHNLLAIKWSSRFTDGPRFTVGDLIYNDLIHRDVFPV